jgi:hypothetical protein
VSCRAPLVQERTLTQFDIILSPRVLTRVWLQTTDRNAPLRAVWIEISAQPTVAAQSICMIATPEGPLCA